MNEKELQTQYLAILVTNEDERRENIIFKIN
jgi:hypothetical protein